MRFFLNSSATCVRRATGTGSTHKYEIRTSARSFRARKFLFLSAPTPALLNASKVGGTAVQTAAAKALRHVSTMNRTTGDVLDELRAQRMMQRARQAMAASVMMQWPPGKPAWFWEFFDKGTGDITGPSPSPVPCSARCVALRDATPASLSCNTVQRVGTQAQHVATADGALASLRRWLPMGACRRCGRASHCTLQCCI